MTKENAHKEHKVSISVAVFSVVSVTIGAGMVSIPKSAFESGIPWAIVYYIWNYLLCILSIHLFLKAAEASGRYSLPELAYECFGYYSLYIVNILQFIGFGMLPIAYFIIFAGLLSSLLKLLPFGKNVLDTQWFSVLVLAIIIFPLIIKKKIQELKIAGVLLFAGVILFIILMFILRIFSGSTLPYRDEDFDYFL